MTAQGPVGCITAMSIIKLKREPLLKSKALTLRGTACACPNVQSEICMHLSFFRKVMSLSGTLLSDTFAFRKASPYKLGHGVYAAGGCF